MPWCSSPRSATWKSTADFLHTGPDGLIDEFVVMLRPLKAVNAFAEKMGAEFARSVAAAGLDG
jgi:hypothetical protein